MIRFLAALIFGYMLVAASETSWAQAASLEEVLKTYQEKSVDVASPEQITAARQEAIRTALRRLDPNAAYFPPGEQSRPDINPLREYAFGFELFTEGSDRFVIPFLTGPLADAGFSEPARLLEVDGLPVAGRTTDAIVAMIRGKRSVRLQLQDLTSAGSPQLITVVARPVRNASVESLLVDGLRVIRVREFRAHETRTSLMKALQADGISPKSVILDLRFNSGGDVIAAIEAASIFIPKGKRIGALEGKQDAPQEFFADEAPFKYRGTVTILMSNKTASAAETFIRAIARYRTTKLIGQQTYGKCSSQSIFRLSDGSMLLLSAFRILDADMQRCNGKGIQPAIAVTGPELLVTQSLVKKGKRLP